MDGNRTTGRPLRSLLVWGLAPTPAPEAATPAPVPVPRAETSPEE